MYNSKEDTLLHKAYVELYIKSMTNELSNRALFHDNTKLESPEKETFDIYTPKLKDTTYGSDEYKEYLKAMNVALVHHYANNEHHPEHHENGIKGMTLIDLCEKKPRIPFSGGYLYCPNCGSGEIEDFESMENPTFCPKCGQAIDWSEQK